MTWKRYCGTVAKAGGNREHKLHPVGTEGSYLLEKADIEALLRTRRHFLNLSLIVNVINK